MKENLTEQLTSSSACAVITLLPFLSVFFATDLAASTTALATHNTKCATV